MGFPYFTITLSKTSPIKALQDYLLTNLVKVSFRTKYVETTSHQQDQFQPSPSLVPLPVHVINKSIKGHLPIKLILRLNENNDEDDEDESFAVCLSSIEKWDMVRELGNCKHAFHVDCIDSWMDHGKETCPLFRAKLLPSHGEEMGKDNGDHSE